MPSTYPAHLRVWASVISQGHVATAASGVMVNAAQIIEHLERELAWSHEQTRERQEHGNRLAKRNSELEAALDVIASNNNLALSWTSTAPMPLERYKDNCYEMMNIAREALGEEKKDAE